MRKVQFILFVFALSIGGCTKVIDFDVSETNIRLVVDGSVTSEFKRHQVRLLKTASYFADKPAKVVSGADVSVSDGSKNWVFAEVPAGSGIYLSDSFAGQAGITYTLTVNSEDQLYTASETMLTGATLDSFDINQEFKPIPFENKTDSSFTVSVWGQEVGGVKNYYMWKLQINSSPNFTDTLKNVNFLDDTGIDGVYIPGFPIYNVEKKYIHSGDTFSVLGYTITSRFYDFMRAILLETDWRGDNPWDGPPSNIPTNISNGAVGYFHASFVSKKTRVL